MSFDSWDLFCVKHLKVFIYINVFITAYEMLHVFFL